MDHWYIDPLTCIVWHCPPNTVPQYLGRDHNHVIRLQPSIDGEFTITPLYFFGPIKDVLYLGSRQPPDPKVAASYARAYARVTKIRYIYRSQHHMERFRFQDMIKLRMHRTWWERLTLQD